MCHRVNAFCIATRVCIPYVPLLSDNEVVTVFSKAEVYAQLAYFYKYTIVKI